MDYNAIRFISEYEYEKLMSGENVGYLNQFKAWDGRKAVFLFPITKYYDVEAYTPIIKHLSREHHLEYDYIVYFKVPNLYTHFAAYDKEVVDKVNKGKELKFDIDEEAYDTGAVYVVPEYRVKAYNKKQIVKVEPIGALLENKEEALNNMPENKIKLGINNIEEDQVTFMNLYINLADAISMDRETFTNLLEDIDFSDEIGFEYLGVELKVGVAHIPIIQGGKLLVKVMRLAQGGDIGLVVPTEVAQAYQRVEEDASNIDSLNQTYDLSFDAYGFNTGDASLIELVSTIYVNSDGASEAFTLTGEAEQELINAEDDAENEAGGFEGLDIGLGSDAASQGRNEPMFDAIEDEIEAVEEITANLESFKRFKNTSKALYLLEEKLYNKVPNAIREHIRTKHIADGKILAIEVNNEAIFETFNNLPGHSRELLTTIGESIRTNQHTQLVDSVPIRRKRLFLVAESINNNYWIVKEEAKILTENRDKNSQLIVPSKKDIILLERSSVRPEARTLVPKLHNKNVAFVSKFKTIK